MGHLVMQIKREAQNWKQRWWQTLFDGELRACWLVIHSGRTGSLGGPEALSGLWELRTIFIIVIFDKRTKTVPLFSTPILW